MLLGTTLKYNFSQKVESKLHSVGKTEGKRVLPAIADWMQTGCKPTQAYGRKCGNDRAACAFGL